MNLKDKELSLKKRMRRMKKKIQMKLQLMTMKTIDPSYFPN